MNLSAKEAAAAPETKTETAINDQSNVLKGIVFDKVTNESLAGAVITANGQKVYTDLDGNFTINNICGGKCEIKISLISYEDQTIEIDTNNAKNVKVQLSQR